ncbi:MAG: hypothetical protein WKG06_31570 [Segetibacter sp.]
MSDTAYTKKIKKEYESAIIEDLEQVDAIAIIEEPVPDWEKEESLKRLVEMKANPSSALSDEEFLKASDDKNG